MHPHIRTCSTAKWESKVRARSCVDLKIQKDSEFGLLHTHLGLEVGGVAQHLGGIMFNKLSAFAWDQEIHILKTEEKS